MKGSEAVAIVQQRMGGKKRLEAEILLEMKLAQQEIENREPRPEILLRVVDDIEVNSIGWFYAPEGFLSEYENIDHSDGESSALWIQNENGWSPLQKLRYNLLLQRYGGQRGRPQYYDLLYNQFFLFPVPEDDVTYTMAAMWYVRDLEPNLDMENKWLKYYPQLVICRTGIALCMFTEEDPKVWTALAQDAEQNFLRDNTTRREANMTTFLGGVR